MGRSGWQALRDDPWLLALVVWLPPLLTGLFIAVFASGLPRDLPVTVVDLDHSTASRALLRQLDASPALDTAHARASVKEGAFALRTGDSLALLVIPEHFEKDVRRGLSPRVEAYYNAQYLLAGKFIASALQESGADFAAHAGAAQRLAAGQHMPEVLAAVAPVRPQITALYNPAMSYARFLVTAIAPAVWQILIVAAMVLLLSRQLQREGLPESGPRRWRLLLRWCLPLTLVYWVQGLLMLGLFRHFVGWVPAGSVLILVPALLFTVLAVQSIALMILALAPDTVRALSLCAAYLAPAFAFMGITFPRGDMPALAVFWGNLMPSTHYVQLQVAVGDHAAPWSALWPSLLVLLLFLLPLPLALRALPSRMVAS